MTRVEDFEELRPLLFSIAYRILGTVGEAEDAVQETWLRHAGSSTEPDSLKAYLSTTVTRIAIDVLRSARVRRERYVGPWIPEPLADDPYQDPERATELAESVSLAALRLLERLSPLERAAFVLREVFGFSYAEVGAAIGRSPAACRQLVARSRRHMQQEEPRFDVDRQERDELARRFFDALRDGDVETLRDLLAAEVHLVGDGGGGAGTRAAAFSAEKAARALAVNVAPLSAIGATLDPLELNGAPGAVFHDRDGRVLGTLVLDIRAGHVTTIFAVNNPEKLGHLGPVADLAEVVRERNEAMRRLRRD